ncbi:hypothetical protein PGT21_013234 [Puccinia graminis f. sp. tritici]|uniref:Uncharacterized protein n=1 Tax=Puccinia graminis f. sp. tritici TaxID=56615 RepID=A0A5B0MA66_PUCGR|nr:hypothetical protein PGT21_013234 [Puccinia graminis f. sp. tritici]
MRLQLMTSVPFRVDVNCTDPEGITSSCRSAEQEAPHHHQVPTAQSSNSLDSRLLIAENGYYPMSPD